MPELRDYIIVHPRNAMLRSGFVDSGDAFEGYMLEMTALLKNIKKPVLYIEMWPGVRSAASVSPDASGIITLPLMCLIV